MSPNKTGKKESKPNGGGVQDSPPPGTQYQMGDWTVTKLKKELRYRNLSPVGKKRDLLNRLEEDVASEAGILNENSSATADTALVAAAANIVSEMKPSVKSFPSKGDTPNRKGKVLFLCLLLIVFVGSAAASVYFYKVGQIDVKALKSFFKKQDPKIAFSISFVISFLFSMLIRFLM